MRKSSLAAIWTACLLLAGLWGNAAAQDLVELPAGSSDVPLSPHIRYHHDAQNADRPEDAWRRAADGGFEP